MQQRVAEPPREDQNAELVLDEFIPYLLTRITDGLGKSLASALRPLRMTNKQWRVLALLAADDGRTISELCAHTAVDHSTLSRVIDRLVTDGQVVRAPNVEDARSTRIRITERGRETFRTLLPIAVAQSDWAVRGIEPAELDRLTVTLRKMLANMRTSPYR